MYAPNEHYKNDMSGQANQFQNGFNAASFNENQQTPQQQQFLMTRSSNYKSSSTIPSNMKLVDSDMTREVYHPPQGNKRSATKVVYETLDDGTVISRQIVVEEEETLVERRLYKYEPTSPHLNRKGDPAQAMAVQTGVHQAADFDDDHWSRQPPKVKDQRYQMSRYESEFTSSNDHQGRTSSRHPATGENGNDGNARYVINVETANLSDSSVSLSLSSSSSPCVANSVSSYRARVHEDHCDGGEVHVDKLEQNSQTLDNKEKSSSIVASSLPLSSASRFTPSTDSSVLSSYRIYSLRPSKKDNVISSIDNSACLPSSFCSNSSFNLQPNPSVSLPHINNPNFNSKSSAFMFNSNISSSKFSVGNQDSNPSPLVYYPYANLSSPGVKQPICFKDVIPMPMSQQTPSPQQGMADDPTNVKPRTTKSVKGTNLKHRSYSQSSMHRKHLELTGELSMLERPNFINLTTGARSRSNPVLSSRTLNPLIPYPKQVLPNDDIQPLNELSSTGFSPVARYAYHPYRSVDVTLLNKDIENKFLDAALKQSTSRAQSNERLKTNPPDEKLHNDIDTSHTRSLTEQPSLSRTTRLNYQKREAFFNSDPNKSEDEIPQSTKLASFKHEQSFPRKDPISYRSEMSPVGSRYGMVVNSSSDSSEPSHSPLCTGKPLPPHYKITDVDGLLSDAEVFDSHCDSGIDMPGNHSFVFSKSNPNVVMPAANNNKQYSVASLNRLENRQNDCARFANWSSMNHGLGGSPLSPRLDNGSKMTPQIDGAAYSVNTVVPKPPGLNDGLVGANVDIRNNIAYRTNKSVADDAGGDDDAMGVGYHSKQSLFNVVPNTSVYNNNPNLRTTVSHPFSSMSPGASFNPYSLSYDSINVPSSISYQSQCQSQNSSLINKNQPSRSVTSSPSYASFATDTRSDKFDDQDKKGNCFSYHQQLPKFPMNDPHIQPGSQQPRQNTHPDPNWQRNDQPNLNQGYQHGGQPPTSGRHQQQPSFEDPYEYHGYNIQPQQNEQNSSQPKSATSNFQFSYNSATNNYNMQGGKNYPYDSTRNLPRNVSVNSSINDSRFPTSASYVSDHSPVPPSRAFNSPLAAPTEQEFASLDPNSKLSLIKNLTEGDYASRNAASPKHINPPRNDRSQSREAKPSPNTAGSSRLNYNESFRYASSDGIFDENETKKSQNGVMNEGRMNNNSSRKQPSGSIDSNNTYDSPGGSDFSGLKTTHGFPVFNGKQPSEPRQVVTTTRTVTTRTIGDGDYEGGGNYDNTDIYKVPRNNAGGDGFNSGNDRFEVEERVHSVSNKNNVQYSAAPPSAGISKMKIDSSNLSSRTKGFPQHTTSQHASSPSNKLTEMVLEKSCGRCLDRLQPGQDLIPSDGEIFHQDCFVCSACFLPFPNGVYYDFDGRKYCEEDFNLMFAPTCVACDQFVKGRVIKAMGGRSWHPDCFVCARCETQLADIGFHSVKSQSDKAYCKPCADYMNKLESGKRFCAKCQAEIDNDGLLFKDEWYHAYHFNCAKCNMELTPTAREADGQLFCLKCSGSKTCALCRRTIEKWERSLVALNKNWHPECLRCSFCDKPFNGEKHFVYNAQPYCEEHYNQLFGNLCFYCNNIVPSPGVTIEQKNRKYCEHHFECFFCSKMLTINAEVCMLDGRPVCMKCTQRFPNDFKGKCFKNRGIDIGASINPKAKLLNPFKKK